MPKPPGLYESIVTRALDRALDDCAEMRQLQESSGGRRLADHFHEHLHAALTSIPKPLRPASQVDLVNRLIAVVDDHMSQIPRGPRFPTGEDEVTPRLLTGIRAAPEAPLGPRPQLPLSESGLYVNANRERQLDGALRLELETADHVDLICAFLFWTGFVRIKKVIERRMLQGMSLRVLTTTYRGVTQARVLEELAALGADVRVSYETRTTRLHAKAWIFHRNTGFSTAYVGSSNLSHGALTTGLEWNVRLSAVENRGVLSELSAAFQNYWDDEEFVPFETQEFAEFSRAERPRGELHAVFDLQPRPFQRKVLERLTAEREVHGRHSNLIVAATGTGKTVIAALDYRRLCASADRRLSLLFVAHRKEILTQSRDTFRHAMSDGSFGELHVDGERPIDHKHVFASVQSLSHVALDKWSRTHFDVLIVDEFHHSAADTYEALLGYWTPRELIGLTATPERADGKTILGHFKGRIASELRLWDAIDRGLLVPFQYFAVHDLIDLRSQWKRGKYDRGGLDKLYSGHAARAHLVVEALRAHTHDASRMRALAFCVGVEHAAYMAAALEKAGLRCALVTGESSKRDRRAAIQNLRDQSICCIVTVDVFNEGVDIPEVDTVLFLRPTESSTLFLQQLGRGLRHAEGKRCLTVLDFVGQPHANFRYAERFRALLGPQSRKELAEQIELEFPTLPSGCSIQLDRQSQELILDNISNGLKLDKRSLAAELKQSGVTSLGEFLRVADLRLDELYRAGRSFSELRRIAGLEHLPAGPQESQLARGLGRLIHVDDRTRLNTWTSWLSQDRQPTVGPADLSLLLMLVTTLLGRERALDPNAALGTIWAHPGIRMEAVELFSVLDAKLVHQTTRSLAPGGLQIHGTYRLNEVMAAFNDVRESGLYMPREGVHYDKTSNSNLLFVTLTKDEADYSATTMYADYAISPTRFHWQSQSGTRPTDKKGCRHLRHAELGITPLLFVRARQKDSRGERVPYRFLGPVTLATHAGERPISIEWTLSHPMPAATLAEARVVA